MTVYRRIGWLTLGVVFFAGAGVLGSKVPLSYQKELLQIVRGVAAFIFGVVGAWVALVYPRALEEVLSSAPSPEAHRAQVDRLVKVVVLSLTVLVGTLLLNFGFIIRWWVEVSPMTRMTLKGASFACISALGVCEIWAVYLLVRPINFIRSEVNALSRRKRFMTRITRRRGEKVDHADGSKPNVE